MHTTKIFPMILIILQFGAGVVYAANRDLKMSIKTMAAIRDFAKDIYVLGKLIRYKTRDIRPEMCFGE